MFRVYPVLQSIAYCTFLPAWQEQAAKTCLTLGR